MDPGSSPFTIAPAHDLGLFAISLERAAARWQALQNAFGALPWPLVRVRALDAAGDADAILARRGLTLAHPPQGVGWNPLRSRMFSLVEEAVFVSHLAALESFLASDHRLGLILEDDAEPVRDPAADLQRVLDCGRTFELVKLEGLRRPGARRAVEEAALGPIRLVRSPTPSAGAAAYLVTRAAAGKLLANAGRELYRYDDYLSNPVLSGCRVLHLSPYLIRQSGSESTMDALRKPVRDIRRRGLRYRFAQSGRRARLRILLWWDAIVASGGRPGRWVEAPWY